jgi:uncharacterized membrane protein YfcA
MEQSNILKFQEESRGEKQKRLFLLMLGGAFIGFVNGFFGAGGGMLAVPVLCFIAKLPEKLAHATAISVILPLSIVSSVVYIKNGALDLNIFPPVLIGTLIGGILGAALLIKLNNKILASIFYIAMFAAGLRLIF